MPGERGESNHRLCAPNPGELADPVGYDIGQPTFQALGTRNGEEALHIVLD